MAHGPSPGEWQRAHRQLKQSPQWENLAFDGIQHAGGRRLVEARRCPDCGSTINRRVDAQRATELLQRFGELIALSLFQVGLSLNRATRRNEGAIGGSVGRACS